MSCVGPGHEPRSILYGELAPWFHLLTPPEDYREEAGFYARILTESAVIPVRRILELGSGGGNNASHLKTRFLLTLTDLSEDMLDVSRGLNPECEHLRGDMRSLRLDRLFDAVFIQDAVSYMKSEDDLRAAMATAFSHCTPGGSVLFCPDYVRETFSEGTEHGGSSKGNRGFRYLEWTWDPDPDDTEYDVNFAFIIRDGDEVRYRSDDYRLGLFSTGQWFRFMSETGFTATAARHYPHRDDGCYGTPVFSGQKPA